MNDVRARPDDHRQGERRRRSAPRVQPERFDEMIVRAMNGHAEMLWEVLRVVGSVPVVASDHLAEVLDDRRYRDGTRDASAGAAPDAVGDDVQVRARPGQPVEDVRVVEVRLAELN